VVRTVPPLNLQLSTQQGTVDPGGNFTYTLTCANISATARNGVTLRASVPAGASFVSADGGGRLIGGVVNWTLGTLTAGDDSQVHVTFQAGAPDTPLGPVNATLTDNSRNVAKASDARAVYAIPQIEYMITTPTARVEPGHVARFDATVRNLSGSNQNVILSFTVPEFTTYGGDPPGHIEGVRVDFLPPGASHTFQLLFNVAGGNMAPPEGTIITLNLIDVARAGSVSRTIELGSLTPNITTDPATNLAAYSATLNGTVDPHGLPTTVHFEYGTTTNYGHVTANRNYTGNTAQNVGWNIAGLTPNTTYHFRLVGTNSSGTKYGSDRTFTTLSPTGAPGVTTSTATNVASFSAALRGSVYPHGLPTTVYFQYGTTTSYGLTTAPQSHSGNTYLNISATVGALSANTVYHFRIVATNSAGTRYGSDRTFTTLTATGPPVVRTNPATNVTSSAARLNGSLDPHGLTTSVYFQYGATTSYGHTTPMQSQSGNNFRDISANIGSLGTHTTYHFRIVATNSGGIRYGADSTFTTP
jgi:conserved repeat domain